MQTEPQKNQGLGAACDIMVVDDQPANLKVMEEILRQQGHAVRCFARGRPAIEAALEHPPDLVLLDINMPEMTGFEVCERLKAEETLAKIPVIFLSALSSASDKVKAFRWGGVDYITKPFQLDEVRARVDTHLKLHRLQKELQVHATHLEELVVARTKELAETQARLRVLDRAKGDFLKLISHEFRSPLNGLLGAGELLIDQLGEDSEELRELFERSRHRILTILDDALLLTEIEVASEQFSPKAIELTPILWEAIERVSSFARFRGVLFEQTDGGADVVLAQDELLLKALQTLLETAVKFSKLGETVRLSSEIAAASVRVLIRGGGTIPASAMAKFFEVFSVGDAITPGGDLGLGPPVAHRILSLFGGSITVENLAPAGIQLAISLPRAISVARAAEAHPGAGVGVGRLSEA